MPSHAVLLKSLLRTPLARATPSHQSLKIPLQPFGSYEAWILIDVHTERQAALPTVNMHANETATGLFTPQGGFCFLILRITVCVCRLVLLTGSVTASNKAACHAKQDTIIKDSTLGFLRKRDEVGNTRLTVLPKHSTRPTQGVQDTAVHVSIQHSGHNGTHSTSGQHFPSTFGLLISVYTTYTFCTCVRTYAEEGWHFA